GGGEIRQDADSAPTLGGGVDESGELFGQGWVLQDEEEAAAGVLMGFAVCVGVVGGIECAFLVHVGEDGEGCSGVERDCDFGMVAVTVAAPAAGKGKLGAVPGAGSRACDGSGPGEIAIPAVDLRVGCGVGNLVRIHP